MNKRTKLRLAGVSALVLGLALGYLTRKSISDQNNHDANNATTHPTVSATHRHGARRIPALSSAAPAPQQQPGAYRPHARDDSEWQGMLVDLSSQPPCETTAHCSLAKACRNGRCGPCSVDADCLSHESCVLDHCVPAPQVACRTRTDCTDERDLCVLNGYSEGLRNNADLRSFCLPPQGGMSESEAESEPGQPSSSVAAVHPGQRRLRRLKQRAVDLRARDIDDGVTQPD